MPEISPTAADPRLRAPEPDQRPDLWPWGTVRDASGVLTFCGVSATELPTPTYVWVPADFRGRAQVWRAAMDEACWSGYGMAGARVHYAGKAFLCGAAAREAAAAGLGIDTATLGELTCALRAGVEPAHIGLHGNNKSVAEIDLAISSRIGRIIADSLDEVDLLEARARALGASDVPVMVRVTTGVHAGGHEYIATAHQDQKFGLSLAGAAERAARAVASAAHLRLLGLHSHIGSQIFATDGFAEAASRLMGLVGTLARRGIAVPEIVLGGGYGIAYTGLDPVAPSPKTVCEQLARAVKRGAEAAGVPVPVIGIEPGRAIAGPAMVTLYSVGTIKRQPLEGGAERTYVSVDGGMSDNIRPALYGAAYTAALANRVSAAPGVRARVVGRHCESGDIVVRDVVLPADLRRGDVLAVPATGAYGHAMASNYNMIARPGVVAVEDGRTTQVIRPERVDDLLRRDATL